MGKDLTGMLDGAINFTDNINVWQIDEEDTLTNMITDTTLATEQLFGFTSATPEVTTFNKPICFNKGTKILCYKNSEEQYIPVEQLKPGDLVKTYLHGYKPLKIMKSNTFTLGKGDDQGMYKMKKSGSMTADLEMTGRHSILVDETDPAYTHQVKKFENANAKYKRPWGWHIDGKFRLTANSCEQFKKMPVNKYTVYTFALDNEQMQYGVWANGLLVETTSHRYISMMK
jgi:hypothetical protein